MQTGQKGFTLIEVLVVVLILSILATIAIPNFRKTAEVTKADNAAAIGNMISSAARMYLLDNPGASISGTITDTCNTSACSGATSGCKLVACNYVAKYEWNKAAYTYFTDNSGGVTVARRTSGTYGTTSSPYSGWGYVFTAAGGCSVVGTKTPDCPSY